MTSIPDSVASGGIKIVVGGEFLQLSGILNGCLWWGMMIMKIMDKGHIQQLRQAWNRLEIYNGCANEIIYNTRISTLIGVTSIDVFLGLPHV